MLGYGDDARGKRGPRHRVEALAIALHPQDFGGPAADVEDQRRFGIAVDQRLGSRRREARFRLAIDDFESEPRLLPHAIDELTPVHRHAAGFGCHKAHALHPPPAQLVGADPQRVDGTRHRVVGQPSALGQLFA